MNIEVLTVSTKGQIVLPAGMRKDLSISAGEKLVAYWNGENIILQPLTLPLAEELEAKMDAALKEKYGLTDEEIIVEEFIKKFRKGRRN